MQEERGRLIAMARYPIRNLTLDDIFKQLNKAADVFREHKDVMDFFTFSNQTSLAKNRRMIKAERNFVNQCFAKYKEVFDSHGSVSILTQEIDLIAQQFQASYPKGSQSQLDPMNDKPQEKLRSSMNSAFELQLTKVPVMSPPTLKRPINQEEVNEQPAKIKNTSKDFMALEPTGLTPLQGLHHIEIDQTDSNKKNDHNNGMSYEQSKTKNISGYSPSAPNMRHDSNESPKNASIQENSSKKHKDSDDSVNLVEKYQLKKKETVRRQSDANIHSKLALLNMRNFCSNFKKGELQKTNLGSQASIDPSNSEELNSPLRLRSTSEENNYLLTPDGETYGKIPDARHSMITKKTKKKESMIKSSNQSENRVSQMAIFNSQPPEIQEESNYEEPAYKLKSVSSSIPRMNLALKVDELKIEPINTSQGMNQTHDADIKFNTPREIYDLSIEEPEAVSWPELPVMTTKRRSNSGRKSNIFFKSLELSPGVPDSDRIIKKQEIGRFETLEISRFQDCKNSDSNSHNSQEQFLSPRELEVHTKTDDSEVEGFIAKMPKKRTYTFSVNYSQGSLQGVNKGSNLELPESNHSKFKGEKALLLPEKLIKLDQSLSLQPQVSNDKSSPFFPVDSAQVPRFDFAEKQSIQQSFAGSHPSPRELREVRSRIELLQTQNRDLIESYKSTKMKLEASQKVVAAYKSESEELKNRIEEYSRQQLEYESKLSVAEGKLSQADQIEAALLAAYSTIKKLKESAAVEKGNQENELSNRDQLELDRQTHKDHVDALSIKIDALVAENESLKIHSQSKKLPKTSILEQNNKALQHELATLIKNRSHMASRCSELEKSVNMMSAKLNNAESDRSKLANDVRDATNRHIEYMTLVQRTNKRVIGKDIEISELQVRNDTLKIAYDTMKAEFEQLSGIQASQQLSNLKLQDENQSLRSQVIDIDHQKAVHTIDDKEMSIMRKNLAAGQHIVKTQSEDYRLIKLKNQEMEEKIKKLSADKHSQESREKALLMENKLLKCQVHTLSANNQELTKQINLPDQSNFSVANLHPTFEATSSQPFDKVIKETGSQWARDAKRQNTTQHQPEEPFLSRTESRRDFFNTDFELDRLNISASIDHADSQSESNPQMKLDIDTAQYVEGLGGLMASIDQVIELSHRCSDASFSNTNDQAPAHGQLTRLVGSLQISQRSSHLPYKDKIRDYASLVISVMSDARQITNFKRSCIDRNETFFDFKHLKLALTDLKATKMASSDSYNLKFTLVVTFPEKISLDMVRITNYSSI